MCESAGTSEKRTSFCGASLIFDMHNCGITNTHTHIYIPFDSLRHFGRMTFAMCHILHRILFAMSSCIVIEFCCFSSAFCARSLSLCSLYSDTPFSLHFLSTIRFAYIHRAHFSLCLYRSFALLPTPTDLCDNLLIA